MASYQTHIPTGRADQPSKHNFPPESHGVECNMCGDVGLREQLQQCKAKGCHRHQHTYCSNWYPDQERSEYAGLCNWCAAAASQVHYSSANTTTTTPPPTHAGAGAGAGAPASSTSTYTSASANFAAPIGKSSKAAPAGCSSSKSPTSSNSPARTAAGRRYKLVSEM